MGYIDRHNKEQQQQKYQLIMTKDGPVQFDLKPDLNTSLTKLERDNFVKKGKLQKRRDRSEIPLPITKDFVDARKAKAEREFVNDVDYAGFTKTLPKNSANNLLRHKL